MGLGEGGLLEKNNEGSAKPAVQGVGGGVGGADESKNSARLGGIQELLGHHRSGVPARFVTGADRKWLGELSGSFGEKTVNILGPVEMGSSSRTKDA